MTFFIKPGFLGIQSIPANRVSIDLLLDKQDYDTILGLHIKNLDNNYVQPLFKDKPSNISTETIKNDLWFRFTTNLWCECDEKKFYQLFFVIRLKSGEVIGAVDLYGSWAGVEMGIFIDKQYSGQNYGTEAITTMITFFKENTDIIKLKWECDYDNVGSLKIAKKCGFIFSHNIETRPDKIGSVFYQDL